jgi:hypothetical protein
MLVAEIDSNIVSYKCDYIIWKHIMFVIYMDHVLHIFYNPYTIIVDALRILWQNKKKRVNWIERKKASKNAKD